MTTADQRTELDLTVGGRRFAVSESVVWSIVVAVESGLGLYLLTWGNTFTEFTDIHQSQLLILGVLGGIGWLAVLRRPSSIQTLLIVAPLPVLGSLAVTSIFGAYPSLSWFATWQCAAYVGIAWLLTIQARHPVGRRNLVAAIGVVVTIVTCAYLLQVAFAWGEWLSLGFPVQSVPLRPLGAGGLLLIPTWLVDVITLGSPVVIVSLWLEHRRSVAVALGLASAAAVVLSGTRSVLVISVSLIVVILLLGGVRTRFRTRAVARATVVAALALAAAAGYVLIASRSLDEGRFSAYQSAITRFASAPLTGTGPGTYGALRMGDPVDVLSHLVFPDAHNLILTAAADSGVIGVAGLVLAVGLYGIAIRRHWAVEAGNRPIILASALGLGIVGLHAMVDVVFALVGLVLMALACLAIASSPMSPAGADDRQQRRGLVIPLIGGLALFLVTSIVVIRGEVTTDLLAHAADSTNPASVAAATEATNTSPDRAPAWWTRMVTADASGDSTGAIASARRLLQLEGFGQQWLELAILADRSGDRQLAADAVEKATSQTPIDPVVELNAIILESSLGETSAVDRAAQGLLAAQPDIETVADGGPQVLQTAIARNRSNVATDLLEAGNTSAAFLVSLSGDDSTLASELVDHVRQLDPPTAIYWSQLARAWFGDEGARADLDRMALADPRPDAILWSWRLAARACEDQPTRMWQRALELKSGVTPSAPTSLGVAPKFQVRLLPSRYPAYVWRVAATGAPYVEGTWTYSLGRPSCPGQ